MNKRFTAVLLIGMTLVGCVNSDTLSGDVYRANDAKQIQSVAYGTIISLRPVKIQSGDENNTLGAIGGAVLGGFLGNTIGGGSGRKLTTAGGAILGGLAGQGVEKVFNKANGIEMEIRKDNGSTIMVVQKQDISKFTPGQRVIIASNGSQVTVSPR